jgi:2-oxoglutarate/2-oxoacid ferredoxin oxidoreductase subunit beta
MIGQDLGTGAPNTWCPGCGNFAILNAMKAVLAELDGQEPDLSRTVLVAGIGCHAKIADYINVNSFYSIHGRATPAAEGIKIGDPGLRVICHAGDGDAYGEGLEHLMFAAKRNIDMTMIVHDNRVYGLTTGQYTPTSPLGFKGRSTPAGSIERPFNPLELMLTGGATFVARGYSHGIENLKNIFRAAIAHKGFSFVDVLQVCVTYFNQYDYYTEHAYELDGHDPSDYEEAVRRAREWDYNGLSPIPLGVFYQHDAPLFELKPSTVAREPADTQAALNRLLKRYE